jgi:uncharacterized coiled-coil DUF342 family protein
MTNDNRIEVELALTADERSAKKAEREVEKLIKSLEDLRKQAVKTDNQSQLKNIDKNIAALRKSGAAASDAASDFLKLSDSLKIADERFSQTSRQVALAGDVESGARTVGGALGAFGATGAERGIAQVSEIPAVIEALPRLKEALVGLPQTAKAAASALGTKGIGLAAVIVTLSVTVAKVANDIAKQSEIIGGKIEAQAEFFDVLIKGTEEDALARVEQGELELQARRAELDQLNNQISDAKQQVQDAGIIAQGANLLFEVIGSTPIEELEKRRTAVESSIAKEEEALDRFNEALDENKFKIEETSEALLTSAQDQADLRRFEQQALENSAEQNAARAEEISNESKIIQEQINTLRATGDESVDVKSKIEELNQELNTLNQQSDILSSNVVKAAEAQKQQAKAAEQAAKADSKIADLQQRISQARQQEAQASAQAAADAAQKRNDAILKLQSDGLKKRAKLINDAQRAEREAQKNFLRERNKLAADQDFKALFELAQSEEDAAQKRAEDFKQKQKDLSDSLKEERKKLLTETKVKVKAGNTQVQNLQRQLQAEIKAKNEAAKAAVNLEIEKGKAVVGINKSIAEQIVMLFRQVGNIAPNINNAQSLTINGQTLPLNPQQQGGVEQTVLNILTQAGVV